jgi:hypothetical protein
MVHESTSRDCEEGRATGQSPGVVPEAYLNGTSQGPKPEDALKDGQIRGRITRLIYTGINPFNLSDALLAILAQRLVRTICLDCKEPCHPRRADFEVLAKEYDRRFSGSLA